MWWLEEVKVGWWAAGVHGCCRDVLDTVWMVRVNIYLKVNDLPLPFAPTNICPLGVWMEG
jgi:hypothetical protein